MTGTKLLQLDSIFLSIVNKDTLEQLNIIQTPIKSLFVVELRCLFQGDFLLRPFIYPCFDDQLFCLLGCKPVYSSTHKLFMLSSYPQSRHLVVYTWKGTNMETVCLVLI